MHVCARETKLGEATTNALDATLNKKTKSWPPMEKSKVPSKNKTKEEIVDLEVDSNFEGGSPIKWQDHEVETFIAI